MVSLQGRSPAEKPKLGRTLFIVALAVGMTAAAVGEAHAITIRRACRRACRDEVQTCRENGGTRRQCRRQIELACRSGGLAVCQDAEGSVAAAAWENAPSNLRAAALSSSSIRLDWVDNSPNESGFAIERSLSASSGFNQLPTTVAANVQSFIDSGLAAGTTYYYRVRSFKDTSKGRDYSPSYSNVASARTTSLATTTSTSTSTTSSTARVTTTSTSTSSSTNIFTTTSTSTSSTTVGGVNHAPIAKAGPDRVVTVGAVQLFDATGSYDPDPGDSIIQYIWNFGDTTSYVYAAQWFYWYSTPGTYTVKLWVQDSHGSWGYDTATVVVQSATASSTSTSTSSSTTTTAISSTTSTTVAAGGDWVATASGTATQMNNHVAVDGSGNVIVAGLFSGSTRIGNVSLSSVAGTTDAFVAKYSAAGQMQWVRTFGGSGSDIAEAVDVDGSGNVVVAGRFTGTCTFGGQSFTSAGGSDIFVVKLSSAGSQQWVRRYGGIADDTANDVAVDSGGNILLTGYFVDAINFGGATLGTYSTIDTDAYLVKLSSAGGHVWSKEFYSTDSEIGYGVAIAPNDEVVLAGSFGGYLNLGGSTFITSGGTDIFLARFTSAGAHRWSKAIGGPEIDRALAVAADANGNVAVAGEVRGDVNFGGGVLAGNDIRADAFVASYSSTGSYRWARRMGDSSQNAAAAAVACDGSGNVTVSGEFRGSVSNFGGATIVSQGLRDVFVAQYGSTGGYRWAERWGGADDDRGLGVAVGGTGRVAASGMFRSTATLLGQTVTSSGGADGYVCQSN